MMIKHLQHIQRKVIANRKFQKGQRDYSKFKCYGCQEMGHIKRNCPHNKKEQVRKGKYKRHHAHATEDDESVQKKRIK
jgi:hypothetical protein